MAWNRMFAHLCVVLLLLAAATFESNGQWLQGRLADTTNRADYVIITPLAYAPTVAPLAAHRHSTQNLTVTTVLLDSVVSQFPRSTADRSIRDFVTTMLTRWRTPRPQYLVLAGNVNTIPSHWTPSSLTVYGEDSVLTDEWFVDDVSGSDSIITPRMAIGRFPAWTADELAVIVAKTIGYDEAPIAAWQRRAVVLAQEESHDFFEQQASGFLQVLSPAWPDTLAVHTRSSSPQYRSTAAFRALWNQGIAFLNFLGGTKGGKFLQTNTSDSAYFSMSDVDSLQAGSPLTVGFFPAKERFDTLGLAVKLLSTPDRGAVCLVAPSGLEYYSPNAAFQKTFTTHLSGQPNMSIGSALLLTKQELGALEAYMRLTLLGDPALVVRHAEPTAAVEPPRLGPQAFTLLQNYPNPFNPTTTIRFSLPTRSYATLSVYNVLGQKVSELLNGDTVAGSHEVLFDAGRLSSGVYFYRLQSGGLVLTRSMTVVK